ncbi:MULTISPECIES: hypothetical protein [unclassified Aureimonas]|uniref:hypothetical protein n=1 Tax=unclassified Aureimonas TaxID=2615206 RepID=UPI0006FC16CA|nr:MULTISPECIES: hypothetical protein [unclassified Aureimonas]KQT60480.1 hypothetical protein ASG62_07475 [Aureimonas sp. Leaf427]KQT79357.1 hypothetical protein ASG54_10075 [Aureimonas sp. Leaf460]
MILEPIGIATIVVGILTLIYGIGFGLTVMFCTLAVGSAAAINLTAVGNSSIQPSHLLVLFITAAALLKPRVFQAALVSLKYPGPGFWFAGFVLYGVFTSYFLPRIFVGETLVYSAARNAAGAASIVTGPLQPATTNITQTVYLMGSLCCYALVSGYASLGRVNFLAKALCGAALTCLLLALFDVATFATDTQYLMEFLRNANYSIMIEAEIGGLKRIVGAFPEASSYGACAVSLFAFVIIMKIERFRFPGLGLITLALGVTVIFSTATTAYVAMLVPIFCTFAFCIVCIVKQKATFNHVSFLVFGLLVVPPLTLGLMLIPSVWETVTTLVETTLANKLATDSGIERMAWNKAALISFLDTYGFGAGLGSVRTSSFLTALLSNVGIVGTLLFGCFSFSLVRTVLFQGRGTRMERSIGMAALFAALTQAAASVISGTVVDLGLLFSATAGLAAGSAAMAQRSLPQSDPAETAPVAVPQPLAPSLQWSASS